ncbi:MAG: 3-phosphoglycerate dehydrogenase [Clostridiales bacterium]|nr:3-phosphoglycerate dehydrogenase [Clostridiales bacterium]
MYKIKTLNSISPVIHNVLSANQYMISDAEPAPEGILVRSAAMHDMVMPESLLAIARAGAGVNNIPLDKCTDQGIVVFNTPGANANAVAELVMAGLLLSSRDISGGIAWAKELKGKEGVEKLVEKGKAQFVGPELKGKKLAVIGLGAIGAIVANIAAQGFGMEVAGYDPYISVAHAWALSRSVHRANTVEEAVKDADYITLHIPLLAENKGMLNANFFAGLKDGVRIMNFSRAELANFDDVKAGIASGKIACYVTDFPTDALLNEKGIVCLPHLGASTPESEDRCAEMAAEEIRDYLEKGIIRNSVNMPEINLGMPEGSRVEVIHRNQPGVVSAISSLIGGRGINIQNMLNKSRGDIAVSVLEMCQAPDETLISALSKLQNVVRVRVIEG